MKRQLLLEDGTIFEGEAIGAAGDVKGEIVFNTGMTGYQESITDQSYNGQILTFTYPLIGNYGINREDYESIQPTCKAVVVYEAARRASNWRKDMTLYEFLKAKAIPGIAGVDTRALTRIIRTHGTMRAALLSAESDAKDENLMEAIFPTNQVESSSTKSSYTLPNRGYKVVVVDFGLKDSILRELGKRQCSVTVVPYDTTAEEILALVPDAVMLTNGPGNPTDVPAALDMIRGLQGKLPIFGICLGHQLFSLANGAKTYKMKFGHRGFNHAVKDLKTGRIDFTSQNHGYAVSSEHLPDDLEVTHIEINDQSVEGLRHKRYPVFTVQFHPDAAPGPHDANDLFDKFITMIAEFKSRA